MPGIEYSPVALEKLGAVSRYIAVEQQNPNGAAATVKSIRDKIRLLKTAPEIGAPLSSICAFAPERFKDARVLLCGKYLAVYQYCKEENMVRVLRIYHSAEDYVRHLFEARL